MPDAEAVDRMQPLMTPEMHRRFSDLYNNLGDADGNAAQVFVPVAPPMEAPLRLLFVGQATRGWSEGYLEDYDAAWRCAADIVATPSPGSQFWQDVRRIVAGIGAAAGTPDLSGALPEVIGWSNILKVGHPDRNPREASWKVQAELCIEQLRYEVAVMRPAAVVLMTRDLASKEVLLPVFGRDGWTNDVPEADRVAWKRAPMPVIWMNHPRRPGGPGYRAAAVETAVRVIGKHMSLDTQG